ncbi:hypothetical protein DFH09DRAFT_1147594 [Mycena vulgaris]|nr:hypothetical protein DFH09DRAFT_1147594 [Mycena vulgaris]
MRMCFAGAVRVEVGRGLRCIMAKSVKLKTRIAGREVPSVDCCVRGIGGLHVRFSRARALRSCAARRRVCVLHVPVYRDPQQEEHQDVGEESLPSYPRAAAMIRGRIPRIPHQTSPSVYDALEGGCTRRTQTRARVGGRRWPRLRPRLLLLRWLNRTLVGRGTQIVVRAGAPSAAPPCALAQGCMGIVLRRRERRAGRLQGWN